MAKKNTRNTKSRIVSAAWKLFYENGYDDTTVDDIVERSGTSKGSFYHYFAGKDALLSSLSTLFDEKYQELVYCVPPYLRRPVSENREEVRQCRSHHAPDAGPWRRQDRL